MCGVITSGPRLGPIVNASLTTTHPDGVFQVVTSTFVPASYTRCVGTLMPNGAKRKVPASRSSRLPNTLGASNRGTHSQSTPPSRATNAPVWQSDKKPKSAIGGNGDGIAALCPWLMSIETPSVLGTLSSEPGRAPTIITSKG